MKALEIRKKNKEDIEKNLNELRKNLNELLFKLAANKLKNVREIRNMKKDIARLLTIIKEQKTENKEQ